MQASNLKTTYISLAKKQQQQILENYPALSQWVTGDCPLNHLIQETVTFVHDQNKAEVTITALPCFVFVSLPMHMTALISFLTRYKQKI